MVKSRYERELKLLESEDAQSGGHDDHGHGGGHDDHGHGAGHGGGHDDHGHGGGHGHDDHGGHGGGHGHDDHGGHGGGHGHNDHGHGGSHGGHDDHGGHGGGHAPAPKAAAGGTKFEDYIENIVFFPAGIMHNVLHIIVGTVTGASISKTVIWDLNSGESDIKGGSFSKFFFGASPFLLLIISYFLYKLAMQSYGSNTAIFYYLAFCAGFAAKPSGRDFKYMQEANSTIFGVIAQPINAITKIYKQVFYGLTGNMAIGVAVFILASYF